MVGLGEFLKRNLAITRVSSDIDGRVNLRNGEGDVVIVRSRGVTI